MRAQERLAAAAIGQLRDSIADAGGMEVFFIGTLGQDRLVNTVSAKARGNESSVPALRPFLNRGDVVIHNHPGGNLVPSQADLQIASELGQNGIGFFIIDNQVRSVNVVAEPVRVRENRLLDAEELAAILAPDGALQKHLDGYEPRSGQAAMLKSVTACLNNDEILAVEAGTGIGKSLAYLIPSLMWAHKNNERIVISTSTINLQQQLLDKDIPLVKRVLGLAPKTVLVKGRGNYLCWKRLKESADQMSLFPELAAEAAKLTEWAEHTKTGSRSEIGFTPSWELWSVVCSEADLCLGLRCRYRDSCFVIRARREAAAAQILIANHHLLFSDLQVRLSNMDFENTAVLPPFQRLVFDEAHNIEASATSYFAEVFSRTAVLKYLNRLHVVAKRKSYGLLTAYLRAYSLPDKQKFRDRVKSIIKDIRGRLEGLEASGLVLCQSEPALLFSGDTIEGADVQLYRRDLFKPLAGLGSRLQQLSAVIHRSFEFLRDGEAEEELVCEMKLLLKRLGYLARTAERFITLGEQRQEIFWMEKVQSPQHTQLRFIITPINISALMNQAVYNSCASVILTSATLAVDNSFQYWKSRIGLSGDQLAADERLVEKVFPSPFDYPNRVMLGIPADAPFPETAGHEDFLADFIGRVLIVSGGRALVLFTSFAQLSAIYARVSPTLVEQGIAVLRQGVEERASLLARFNADTSSVLLATASFWEGVDMPGEALEVLIVCRLPFKVPSHPVLRARAEHIQISGGNPFMELSLPEAVMKLKQGCGRLMRRSTDRGVILILDPRIIKRHYGRFFLGSLPRTKSVIAPSGELLTDIDIFLKRMRID